MEASQNSTSIAELKNNVRPGDNAVSVGLVDGQSFALAQRIATMLANSTLVPKHYQGNMGNCVIALNMANRIGADPLMVMQNLYVVHGNPSWSAQFLIACFNKCGRFSSLRYEFGGKEGEDSWSCRAWAVEKESGERLDGTVVSVGMAKKEGWYGKTGSKWQTMPQQMLMYRAASWFVRAYAPEIAMGLHTSDEIRDTYDMEPAEDGAFTVGQLRQEQAVVVAVDPDEPTYLCPDEEGIRIKASICAKCAKAKDCPEYGPSHQ
jgi:hypothetical protein